MDEKEQHWELLIEEIMHLAEELGWQWVIVRTKEGEVVGMKIGTDKYLKLDSDEITRLH